MNFWRPFLSSHIQQLYLCGLLYLALSRFDTTYIIGLLLPYGIWNLSSYDGALLPP